MQSDAYDLGERYTVSFTPKTDEVSAPVIDPKTETVSFLPKGTLAKPVRLEVFLLPAGQVSRNAGRAGLDLSDGRRVMQIVGTEGDAPLKLPDGVSAGDKAEVVILGQRGTIEVQALSPAQIPEVSDEMGWLYNVAWQAVRRG